MKNFVLILFLLTLGFSSCKKDVEFEADFNNTNDRTWIGQDFWSIPVEEWMVRKGRLECNGKVLNSRVNVLTHVLVPDNGSFTLSAKMGLLKKSEVPGSAGFLVGIYDDEDPSAKAACYYGESINAGVSMKGYAFLGKEKIDLPKGFNWGEFTLLVKGNNYSLLLIVLDAEANTIIQLKTKIDGIQGLVGLASNISIEEKKAGKSSYWFDDLRLSGSKVTIKEDNAFGPILWTTYTLSKNTVKLMVQMPPIGKADNQFVDLHIQKERQWKKIATEKIEPDSRTAIFKLENWNNLNDTRFRVVYADRSKDGNEVNNYYKGMIRHDPIDKPLKFAAMTCQHYNGYPYSPLIENLKKANPDFLYFSGDQIYEFNGGYNIIREPDSLSILNYLGKYYMFGWAFGDLMRDRPTVCTPDDHDVYHGNLWGESGKHLLPTLNPLKDDLAGFRQSTRMVNVVNRTQCGNLPDPYDPTSIDEGMSVWYTDITYGRISFAVVSDRIYKTAPEAVSTWDTRKDHLLAPLEDHSQLIKPGLKMLGDRQIKFLADWILDWEGADMKVLLTQTVFAGVATHHGSLLGYLHGDLDSGGWPKNGRDRAIKLMRKGFVFQIAGDQHIPSLVQYGLNDYRDAGWCFCTPAITVGYQRWFLPDELGWKILDRSEHGEPNTGKYEDAFGNKNYVYAIGNPDKQSNWDKRYYQSHMRSSGFGVVTFNQLSRDITIDSWRFLANIENPGKYDQFSGWPLTISQLDNYGKKAVANLPEIEVNKPNQIIQVIDNKGELVYIYRMIGNSFQPKVFKKGTYSVIIGEGRSRKNIEGIKSGETNKISVSL